MPKKEKKEEKKNESIGALWVNKGKKQTYLAGQIEIDKELYKIVVFKNNYKQEDKQPDYRIYFKNEKAEEQEAIDDLPF